jgi:hypothetical protein
LTVSAARACAHRGRNFVDLGANSIEPRHVTFVAANGDAGARDVPMAAAMTRAIGAVVET